MTPAAQHQAAIEVLDIWLTGERLERAFGRWSRGARYAGSKDRRAVRDIVYAVLRNRGRARALGTSPVSSESGRALVFGWLRLCETELGRVFTGQGHAPAPLGAEERRILGQRPPIPIYLDTPDWLLERLKEDLAADTEAVLQEMAERAPTYLRVNAAPETLEAAKAAAIKALAQTGIGGEATHCATALRVAENAPKVALSEAYTSGLVELQDLSVQMALAAISWPKGARILDYCAGGGGKALAIAAATQGPVYVHDANPARMGDLPKRAARARADLPLWTAGERAEFDAVLCDVPCSGSGTWRRDPEARWRLSPADLEALRRAQADILDQALSLLAPGGRLIYMTCSLLEAENGAQARDFCARHPGWRICAEQRFTPLSASDGFYFAELTAARDAL